MVLPRPTPKIIEKLYDRISSMGICMSNSTTCLLSALIYIVCKNTGRKVTQKNICDKLGVTEVSIRNIINKIYSNIDIKEFINTYNKK